MIGEGVDLTVQATGGTTQFVSAGANGVDNNSTVGNNATITVTATGGTAKSDSVQPFAHAYARGVSESSTVGDNAHIKVKVNGGTATASASSATAYAKAYGVSESSTVGDNATVTVTAAGGKATASSGDANTNANANADAYGVQGNSRVGDNAVITVTATGGEAKAAALALAIAYAYGVQGSSTVGDSAVIKVTAIGGMATSNAGYDYARNYAYAYGVYAWGDVNTLQGAAKIISKAEGQASGASFRAWSLYAGGENNDETGTNNLIATGKTKILEGDVEASSYGINKLVLDTADSYLQGNILSVQYAPSAPLGTNNITISNGAVWRPVYDNRYGTDCDFYDTTKNVATNKVAERKTTYDAANKEGTTITLNQDGIIDLTWDGWTNGQYDTTRAYRTNGDQQSKKFRSLKVGKLDGADGIVKVDSNLANNLSDTITVGVDSTATSLRVQVNYDDFYAASKLGDFVTGEALVVTDNSGKLIVTGGQSEYNENTYAVQVEKDADATGQWNITKITDISSQEHITENTKHAADSRDNVNNIWNVETNSLAKRLGDLRSMSKNTDKHDNMWAKYGHGTQEVGASSRNTEIKYNQFQLGYDKLFARGDGKLYRGIMVSRINGDAAYERGSGDTNSTTVGLYQTWLGNKGHYYDAVLRYGKITSDYHMTDLNDNYSTADYSMWATTLSGEYGYRKNLGKGAYIEPSAEVIFGHVGGADYTTSKNMKVSLDATNHAIARLGIAAGREFGQGSAYCKANYYHDFAGGGAVTTGSVNYENDAAKNWGELGIGGDVRLGKNASAYAEVRKMFGNLKSNVNFSVGARWGF